MPQLCHGHRPPASLISRVSGTFLALLARCDVTFWGALDMAVTAAVGALCGTLTHASVAGTANHHEVIRRARRNPAIEPNGLTHIRHVTAYGHNLGRGQSDLSGETVPHSLVAATSHCRPTPETARAEAVPVGARHGAALNDRRARKPCWDTLTFVERRPRNSRSVRFRWFCGPRGMATPYTAGGLIHILLSCWW